MKTIKIINIDNTEASVAKQYVRYLKEVDVNTDVILKPGTADNNIITFYYRNDHSTKAPVRIKNSMVEIFDNWDEQYLQEIFDEIDDLMSDETLIWDKNINDFVE